MIDGYESLYSHFKSASEDKTRSKSEMCMFEGLLKQISSRQFISNLALMYDILFEISVLSVSLL